MQSLMCRGREFQRVGAAMEKALSPQGVGAAMEKALSPQVRCLVCVGIDRRLASDEFIKRPFFNTIIIFS